MRRCFKYFEIQIRVCRRLTCKTTKGMEKNLKGFFNNNLDHSQVTGQRDHLHSPIKRKTLTHLAEGHWPLLKRLLRKTIETNTASGGNRCLTLV